MKILKERSHNGSTIRGEAVMLSRYGDVYNVIDNSYHPNPGLKNDGYPEIERCVDWLYQNKFSAIKSSLDEWIKVRVSLELEVNPEINLDDLVDNVMYSDLYEPCSETVNSIKSAKEFFNEDSSRINIYLRKNEIDFSEKIVNFINEKFLRVRAGGKLNPEGTDSIYFRISSHGYDWHRTIVDFLWDTFGSVDKMPKKIWIGHDAETNPPETVLFDGTPEDLFEKADQSIFEKLERRQDVNQDRENARLNKLFYESIVKSGLTYKSFK